MITYIAHGGSHLYNTATPNSDMDIRNIFVRGLDEYFTITKPDNSPVHTNHLDVDVVSYELVDFVRKIVGKHSAECFEILYDKNPIYIGDMFIPLLKEIAPYLISKKLKKHYIDSANGLYRSWCEGNNTNKVLADATRRMIMAGRLNAESIKVNLSEHVFVSLAPITNELKNALAFPFNPRLENQELEDVMCIKGNKTEDSDAKKIFMRYSEIANQPDNLPDEPNLFIANGYLTYVGYFLSQTNIGNFVLEGR